MRFISALLGQLFFANLGSAQTAAEIQGTWKMTSLIANGKSSPTTREVLMEITGNEMKLTVGKASVMMTYTIDSSHKPAHIDRWMAEAVMTGPAKGLVTIENGKLAICMDEESVESRPTSFTAKAGQKLLTQVFERQGTAASGPPSYKEDAKK